MSGSWPGGYRHAISQREHVKWNAEHYPGTRQLCSKCEEPTGKCEDDAIFSDEGEPICEDCYDQEKAEAVGRKLGLQPEIERLERGAK